MEGVTKVLILLCCITVGASLYTLIMGKGDDNSFANTFYDNAIHDRVENSFSRYSGLNEKTYGDIWESIN